MKQIKNPNGYGSVYKLNGNRRKPFVAIITVGMDKDNKTGKLIQKREPIGYYEKYLDAVAALVKYNESPYDLNSKKITFKEVYVKWTATEDYTKLSDSTKKSHSIAFNKIKEIHKVKFCKLNAANLQEAINSVAATPSVRMQIKKLLGNLFTYAEKYDIVQKNYAKFLEVGDISSKIQRRIYTHDEVCLLWDNLNKIQWVDSILFMLYTGFRVSEMLDIKINDVDLKNKSISGGKKTAAGIRTIPIHSKIYGIVNDRYDENFEYLFRSSKGTKITPDSYRVTFYNPIMQSLNLTGSGCHDLRHTFCSKMDNYNINPTTLKRLMGPSTKDVTDIYTHKTLEDLSSAIELLEY